MSPHEILAYEAYQLRLWSLRATSAAGSGHLTSCLSAADLLSVIFFHALKFDIKQLNAPNNDRFILSKGHAAPLLYAALKELGVISEQELLENRTLNSRLEGHPTPRCPFVDIATGSLGIGLSAGVGMALNAQLKKLSYYTYVLLGDSELTEGTIWEAATLAAHYQTNQLIALVDANRLGQRGPTIDEHHLEKIAAKFSAFGWHTYTVDGHDIPAIVAVFDAARACVDGRPQIIIAKTIKGYGLKELEDKNGFHGKALEKNKIPAAEHELAQRFYKSSWRQQPKPEKHTITHTPQKHATIILPTPTYTLQDSIATREAFGHALEQAGNLVPHLLCLDAEVSNSTRTELFAHTFPARFIECFIAEQNMIGMAMGLAARNNMVFSSTFAAFLTRAHDQLRMAGISQLPLRIIGSHVGVEVGQDGPSQMGLEDIGVMRSIPESIVLYPCDAVSCHKLVGLMLNYHDGISYLRTTRGPAPVIYDVNTHFEIGGFHILRQSRKDRALVISAGICTHEALAAHAILQDENINIAIVDLYCIKPLDAPALIDLAQQCKNRIIIVEDHYQAGGIYEAVCAAIAPTTIECFSRAVNHIPTSAKRDVQLHAHKIDALAIIELVKETL